MALSDEDQWKLILWRIAHSDPGRTLNWARSMKACIEELQGDGTESAAALFWIRLFGLLHDIHHAFGPKPLTEFAGEDLDPAEKQALAEEEYLADLAAAVRDACETLRKQLSDDELLTIQWKRDHEAHPFLDAYDLSERKGALKHDNYRKLVDKTVTHRDVHDAVKRVRGGRSDLEVARGLRRSSELTRVCS